MIEKGFFLKISTSPEREAQQFSSPLYHIRQIMLNVAQT